MASNRIIFSLGDGFDSITGAHKGRGIISFKGEKPDPLTLSFAKDEESGGEKKAFTRPRAWVQVASGDTQYDITVISDYEDLYQALELKTSLTALTVLGSGSSEIALFKKAKLSKQSLSLLVKGSKIGYIHVMPPDSYIDTAHIQTLEQRPATFIESHGDEYISQVMYGKKIYALINFENTSKEEILNIKQSLEAGLANPSAGIAAAAIKTKYSGLSTIKHTVSDIYIEFTGVDLGLPSISGNIENLLEFINQFNRAELIDAPIGFVSEPYVTILPIRSASELSKQIAMIHPLILKYENTYNRVRSIIPTIEKILSGIRHFQLDEESCLKKVNRIHHLLNLANEYKITLEDLILEINSNKIDLSTIPEHLSKRITLDIPRMLKSTEEEMKNDDQMSADFHKRQFYIYEQLNTIVKLYSTAITLLETDVDTISQQLVAEIARTTKTNNQFYLHLPPTGANIRWDIINKNENKYSTEVKSFNISETYKCKIMSKPLYTGIWNGMEVRIVTQPGQQLTIEPHGTGDYEIVASVVGMQALDSNIARHTTGWITKTLSNVKSNNPSSTPKAIEFNGKSTMGLSLIEEEKAVENEETTNSLKYILKPGIAV